MSDLINYNIVLLYRMTSYYQQNKKKLLEYQKIYNKEHKDKIKIYNKSYGEKYKRISNIDKEIEKLKNEIGILKKKKYSIIYYQKNREKILKRRKEKLEANSSDELEKKKKKRKEYCKRYYKKKKFNKACTAQCYNIQNIENNNELTENKDTFVVSFD